ncbi:MAG: apolipoprotein N-acyltransferase, partial [Geobacter sp.]
MSTSSHLSCLFKGGWRSLLLALVSGLLIALSFPLPGISPLAWVALIPLLIALEGQSPAAGFRLGFITGFTAYCGLLYWVTIVMTDYGNLPWLVSVALWWCLAAWLAAFYGLTAWAAALGKQRGCKWVLLFPLAWVGADYLRSILLTGFPWTMLGHSQYRLLPLIQIADMTGVYGITALVVLANVVFYRILRALTGADIPYPAKSAVLLVLALAVTFWYGFHRLNVPLPDTTPLRVALIQGNIDQSIKWSPAIRQETLAIYRSLSRQALSRG